MRIRALAAALLWSTAASAAPPAVVLSFEGRLAGARIIQAQERLEQTAAGYTLHTAVHTVGGFAAMVRGYSNIISQGTFAGDTAAPSHVDSESYWNGHPRRMIMDYIGGVPVLRVMTPPDPQRRRALGAEAVAGTTDLLGLLVGLMHQVAVRGQCDRTSRVFDGRGVTEFVVSTAMPRTGAGLRCDFTTRKVAGLAGDEDGHRLGHGYVVFSAASPALPVLPTRIVFRTRWTGDAVLALTDAR